ncbi:serine/threonine-protein kinase mos [Zophobas morio]|uniref:serine/threonine-protein kinase mos n=1 Tax=Zophobas morio TaxID=2755281 RepID=UPI0030839327
MSTPLKSASSFLLQRRCLSPRSPRLLSSHENKQLFLSVPSAESEPKLTPPKKLTKISHDFPCEESLNLNTPRKESLLNNGLNKYDLPHLIGKGSFGTVLKGNCKGDMVAIKLIKIKSPSDQINENNARSLLHRNIIRILDVKISRNYGLVVMEYYKNSKNLQDIMDENTTLSEEIVANYSLDVTKGLKHCHENGVLHLDIKPKNILLCNNVCKICDFGNSMKEFDSNQIFRYQGTVAYTAPEILKGKTPSSKCDIYSLGFLIWQLMSGKNPYECLDNEVIIYKVVKYNFRPSLSFKNENLSKLCSMCWNENPAVRPTAADVCDSLENILANISTRDKDAHFLRYEFKKKISISRHCPHNLRDDQIMLRI